MTRTDSSSTQACPCSNGGVCNISEGTIICECQEGFKGQFCSGKFIQCLAGEDVMSYRYTIYGDKM